MVAIGSSFLVPSGPGEFLHLHVVCTGQAVVPDMRLLVSVTSIRPGAFHDRSCIILPGEHPFIAHPSYVAYRHAQERSAAKISAGLENGIFVTKPAVSAALLDRIILGFRMSDFSPPWAMQYLNR